MKLHLLFVTSLIMFPSSPLLLSMIRRMSLEIAERQLARLNVLHAATQYFPGGKVITREEGVKLARRSTVAAKEEAAKDAATEGKKAPKISTRDPRSNLTGTAIEKETSKKIVMLRAKQNKVVNIKAALDNYRQDTVPEAAIAAEMPGVKTIAKTAFKKGQDKTAQAIKAERNARLGVVSRKSNEAQKGGKRK